MSEKKSWDIQPKRKPAPQPVAPTRPTQSARPMRREVQVEKTRHPLFVSRKKPKQRVHEEETLIATRPARREKVLQGKDREPLKERRKRARRRTLWTLIIFFVLLIAGIIGAFWLPFLRVQQVQAAGSDSEGMQTIAEASLHGTYNFVFPRNSIFLFPEEEIRANILKQYPDISAVAISRSSFDSIALASIPREAALTWCGPTYMPEGIPTMPVAVTQTSNATSSSATSTPDTGSVPLIPTCYSADATGVIFAPVAAGSVATPETIIVYGGLSNTPAGASPLGAVISDASMIPNALQFVKAMRSLNAPVTTLVLRGDEADLYTQAGTRITYVLGQEHDAAQLAESAFPSLNLTDGSLDYIDLRFEGKVYFKKKGDDTQASTTGSQ